MTQTTHDTPARRTGRQPATTHGELSRIALELFTTHGFDHTTIDDVAAAAGVSRRTLFRYFPSKNDLPWGDFDTLVQQLSATLAATPEDISLFDALRTAIISFNSFPDSEATAHRERMKLLIQVPTLAAHSTLRYDAWRAAVAGFVAQRHHLSPDDLCPRTVGSVCLGICLAAYEQWLAEPNSHLPALLNEAFLSAEAIFIAPGVSGAPGAPAVPPTGTSVP